MQLQVRSVNPKLKSVSVIARRSQNNILIKVVGGVENPCMIFLSMIMVNFRNYSFIYYVCVIVSLVLFIYIYIYYHNMAFSCQFLSNYVHSVRLDGQEISSSILILIDTAFTRCSNRPTKFGYSQNVQYLLHVTILMFQNLTFCVPIGVLILQINTPTQSSVSEIDS